MPAHDVGRPDHNSHPSRDVDEIGRKTVPFAAEVSDAADRGERRDRRIVSPVNIRLRAHGTSVLSNTALQAWRPDLLGGSALTPLPTANVTWFGGEDDMILSAQ